MGGSQVWKWLTDETNREVLGWLGGGVVVVVGAAWTLYLHWSRRRDEAAKPDAAPQTSLQNISLTASGGSVAAVAGGNVHIDQRDPLVAKAFEALKAQLAKKDEQLAAAHEREAFYQQSLQERQGRQEAGLREAVEAIPQQTDVPDAQAKIRRALELAAGGDTQAAKALFAEVKARRVAEGRAANREAAEAARHLGALALLSDTAEAVAAFEEATELDPEHLETWFLLGQARRQGGQLDGARTAYKAALAIAQAVGDRREVARANVLLGAIHRAQGNLGVALSAYEASLAIAKDLAETDRSNIGRQHDLSICHMGIGDVRFAQGDFNGALDAFQQSLAIFKVLSAADPGNTEWHHGLSATHNRIGYVHRTQGNLDGALDAYKHGLAILKRLAAADRGNAELQRDFAVSHSNLGDVRFKDGDLEGALAAYEASLDILDRVAATDRSNTGWQRDFAVSQDKVGDVRLAQRDLVGALSAYEASLATFKDLAASDPSNNVWQHDLSVSYSGIGNVRLAQGDLAGALEGYKQSLAFRDRISDADWSNVQWQTSVAASCLKLAQVMKELPERSAEARKHLTRGLSILTDLQERSLLPAGKMHWIEDFEAALQELHGSGLAPKK